ncbi:unnamed protein product [Linum trigynum]|uniref:Uncharacterized protein n=1 Tax=Linum trigynum TaxID=586398 RepID=A0AAV2G1W0_9ROSI
MNGAKIPASHSIMGSLATDETYDLVNLRRIRRFWFSCAISTMTGSMVEAELIPIEVHRTFKSCTANMGGLLGMSQ